MAPELSRAPREPCSSCPATVSGGAGIPPAQPRPQGPQAGPAQPWPGHAGAVCLVTLSRGPVAWPGLWFTTTACCQVHAPLGVNREGTELGFEVVLGVRKREPVGSGTEYSTTAVHVNSILWFSMSFDLPNNPRNLVGPSASFPFCIENTEPRNRLHLTPGNTLTS